MKKLSLVCCLILPFLLLASVAEAKGRSGYRSAKSGRYTSGAYAKSHTSTTVHENR